MSSDSGLFPTILDPSTCIKKELCTVAQGRSTQTYQLYYEVHGTLNGSQKMLFVMGLNNSCSGWSNQVEHFSRKPDHSILVFDNRGVGNSDSGPLSTFKTSEMAKDIVDLLEYMGWTDERSVHLFGISMGGMISQELCLLIPKRFKSVSFISTKAGDKLDFPSMKGLYMFGRLLSKTVSEQKGIELIIDTLYPEKFLLEKTEDGSRTHREELFEHFLKRVRTTKKQTPAGTMGQMSAVMGHSCSKESLKKIADDLQPAKILVVTGDEDQLINPCRSLELHQALPGSEHVVIPGAGHAVCSQLPREFNALLERVMDEGNQAFR